MGYVLRLLLPVAAFLALVFGLSQRAAPEDAMPRFVCGSDLPAFETDVSLPTTL